MNKAYKYLFSGFLLVMLDLNIGSFDILPDVIGYFLIFSGLKDLHSHTKVQSFNLAKVLSILMVISATFVIMVESFGLIQLGSFSTYVFTIIVVLGDLLLVICLYQGMSEHMILLEETVLYQSFASENKRYGVIQGLSLIAISFSINMPKDISGVYLIGLFAVVSVSFIMHIRLLMNLHYAKELFDTQIGEVIEE